jgi:hypothetical protein
MGATGRTNVGDEKWIYKIMVEKHEGKNSLGRRRRRWKDNIKMDLKEIRCGDMHWISRILVNVVKNYGLL